MKLRFWLVPILTLLLLITFGCSTKTTLSPTEEKLPYTILSTRDLPPQVATKAREMKNNEKSDSTLFYTNNTNYVLITSGRKSTGGYSIQVTRVSSNKNGEATIYVNDIPPKKGAMVPQIVTSPVLVISVPENIKRVHLIWE